MGGRKRLSVRMRTLLIGAVVAVLLVTVVQLADLSPSRSAGFRFSAAGDFGSWTGISESMNQLTSTQSDFMFALGDLSYGGESEQEWCTEFKRQFEHVEIIAGNHDTGQPPTGEGNINRFALYCPYTLREPLTGVYGKQYYFDYPLDGPIARFILISPDLQFVVDGGEHYRYAVGTPRYNWTRDAIDGARDSGIPWVIVGMHKNCIAAGEHACETGPDILNLLLDRKVDMILQAHTHHYERTKQLALNPSTCVGIHQHLYNPECVVDDGSDAQYARGSGSVLVIAGTGGRDIDPFNVSDPHSGYVAAWDADNLSGSGKGVVSVDVDANRISVQTHFAGSNADAFTISGTLRLSTIQTFIEVVAVSAAVAIGVAIVVVWRLRKV